MGFKDDVRAKAVELEQRVSALETLAEEIKRERTGRNTVASPVAARTGSYDGVTGSSRASVQTSANGLDYGAVAFGLSEIKRKTLELVTRDGVGRSQVTGEYAGTVQYFADVFSKSDPSFNEADFKRQSGV